MKRNKGFSLVELLVAMAIIAVLVSIAAFGISIVQRNARDTQRRKIVENVYLTLIETELNAGLVTRMNTHPGGMAISMTGTGSSANYTFPTPYRDKRTRNGTLPLCSAFTSAETTSTGLHLCYTPNEEPREIGVRVEGSDNPYMKDID